MVSFPAPSALLLISYTLQFSSILCSSLTGLLFLEYINHFPASVPGTFFHPLPLTCLRSSFPGQLLQGLPEYLHKTGKPLAESNTALSNLILLSCSAKDLLPTVLLGIDYLSYSLSTLSHPKYKLQCLESDTYYLISFSWINKYPNVSK